MLTIHEITHLIFSPFLPALYYYSRHDLHTLIKPHRSTHFHLLDIGGRKSPYTIGLPAKVTLIDLPREREIQKELHLGLSDSIVYDLKKQRSNIENVIIGDMLAYDFQDKRFDAVVCIEVIEHIEQDERFLCHIKKTIKPGGWLFLSTPNGDYVKNEPPNYNPDHQRHYTKIALYDLLDRYFDEVEIWYGIKTGKNRYRGLRSFKLSQPLRTIQAMISNFLNILESRDLRTQPRRTAHLFAIAKIK